MLHAYVGHCGFWKRTPIKTKGEKLLNHIDSDMKWSRGWFEDDNESEPVLPAFETVCGKAEIEKLLDPADVKNL